mgnify:CR=1 FL=1
MRTITIEYYFILAILVIAYYIYYMYNNHTNYSLSTIKIETETDIELDIESHLHKDISWNLFRSRSLSKFVLSMLPNRKSSSSSSRDIPTNGNTNVNTNPNPSKRISTHSRSIIQENPITITNTNSNSNNTCDINNSNKYNSNSNSNSNKRIEKKIEQLTPRLTPRTPRLSNNTTNNENNIIPNTNPNSKVRKNSNSNSKQIEDCHYLPTISNTNSSNSATSGSKSTGMTGMFSAIRLKSPFASAPIMSNMNKPDRPDNARAQKSVSLSSERESSMEVVVTKAKTKDKDSTTTTTVGKIICDKCDGKHKTDDCPHFKKPRESHPDATSRSAGLGAAVSTLPGASIRSGKVMRQPGDGSCLYHSLSYGLRNTNASALRAEICSFMMKNPTMKISDTPISEWVQWDSGTSVQDYAKKMSRGAWGGGIEMAIVSKMKSVNVHVYEKTWSGGFKRISAFDVATNPSSKNIVRVLYCGGVHYGK